MITGPPTLTLRFFQEWIFCLRLIDYGLFRISPLCESSKLITRLIWPADTPWGNGASVPSPSGLLSAYWYRPAGLLFRMFFFLPLSLSTRCSFVRWCERRTHGDLSRCCSAETPIVRFFFAVAITGRISAGHVQLSLELIHMDWSEPISPPQHNNLVCQCWEVCQAAYSTTALSRRDKTEMTRQSPFCQHCHGSTGVAFYPKVNGMMPESESARLRKTSACFSLNGDGVGWCQQTAGSGKPRASQSDGQRALC